MIQNPKIRLYHTVLYIYTHIYDVYSIYLIFLLAFRSTTASKQLQNAAQSLRCKAQGPSRASPCPAIVATSFPWRPVHGKTWIYISPGMWEKKPGRMIIYSSTVRVFLYKQMGGMMPIMENSRAIVATIFCDFLPILTPLSQCFTYIRHGPNLRASFLRITGLVGKASPETHGFPKKDGGGSCNFGSLLQRKHPKVLSSTSTSAE